MKKRIFHIKPTNNSSLKLSFTKCFFDLEKMNRPAVSVSTKAKRVKTSGVRLKAPGKPIL